MQTTPGTLTQLAYADALTGINVAAIDAACAALPTLTVWEL